MHPIISSLLLLVAPHSAQIKQVVVYPDRAQVTRSVGVACEARTTVSFEGIPPSADPASFRAHASAGSVLGLRGEERTRREAYSAEAESIDKQLHQLDLDRAALGDGDARSAASRDLANRYTNVAVAMISRETVDAATNEKHWGAALDSALAARLRASEGEAERATRRRAIDRKRQELYAERQRLLLAGERREYLSEVLVGCPAGQRAEVSLTYTVGGASWSPAYEARADEARGEIELSTYATVSQSTGEPWKGATVILSTAIPRDNATPPEIAPLHVGAYEHKAEKKVLVRHDEARTHAQDQTIANGAASSDGSTGEGGLHAAAEGLSVQLQVDGPADVAGDGSPAHLLVGRAHMKAQFVYRTVPKLMPFVFRVADVVNTAPFPLLEGPLDTFMKAGLTGHYAQERVPENGRFQITFGIEERMRATRQTMEEVTRDRGLFATTRRFRYAYRFEIATYTDGPQTIELSEHVPVSELDDVKVTIDPKTTGGYALKADDGIVLWKLALRPGEKRTVDLAYFIDVPSSYDSGGM